MNEHISKENILKFASGLLSLQEQKIIETHLRSCEVCLGKIAHGYAKVHQSCAQAQAQFAAYQSGTLKQSDEDFVRKHLLICDFCLKKYRTFVEKWETVGDNSICEVEGKNEEIVNNITFNDNMKSKEELLMEGKIKELYRQIDVNEKSDEAQKAKTTTRKSTVNKNKD